MKARKDRILNDRFGLRRLIMGMVALSGLASPAGGELATEEIIALARSYLASDDRLEQVTTIKFRGVLELLSDGSARDVTILLKKPLMQRREVYGEHVTERTAINDFDGWIQLVNNANPSDWSMNYLQTPEMKRLRANTVENLYFYEGIDRLRGEIVNEGKVRKDGRDAYFLVFRYDEDIFFERYFDSETGELISTIVDDGSEMKEIGEFIVNGIKFPEKIVSLRNGDIINSFVFLDIQVNEEIDDAQFNPPQYKPSSIPEK